MAGCAVCKVFCHGRQPACLPARFERSRQGGKAAPQHAAASFLVNEQRGWPRDGLSARLMILRPRAGGWSQHRAVSGLSGWVRSASGSSPASGPVSPGPRARACRRQATTRGGHGPRKIANARSASGSPGLVVDPQVRAGLTAGGRRIRTVGPPLEPLAAKPWRANDCGIACGETSTAGTAVFQLFLLGF
jgi:hypothetical protein